MIIEKQISHGLQETFPKKDKRFLGFEKIMDPIKQHMIGLDLLLAEEIGVFEPEVREMVTYAFANKGKRLRPMCVFYAGWQGREKVSKELVRAAAVVELIHLATLVHDDILDEALIRHNSATINQKFGSKEAILLGDALFAHALKLASEFLTTDVCKAVSNSTRLVCTGEIIQTFHRGRSDITLDQYFRVIDLKTAELFRISAYLGGKISEYPQDYIADVSDFGKNFGMSYQIFDDLIDIVGNEQRIGKTLGTDLYGGKYTLPIILLFQKMEQKEAQALIKLIQASKISNSDICEKIRQYRILEEVKKHFLIFARNATKGIRKYPQYNSILHLIDIQEVIISELSRFFS